MRRVTGPRGGVVLKASEYREEPPVSEKTLVLLIVVCVIALIALKSEFQLEKMLELVFTPRGPFDTSL